MTSSPGQMLPHSPEAERACLGAMILKNALIDDVFTQTQPEDFFDLRNKEIANAIRSYREEHGNQPIDIITLSQFLKNNEKLDKAGGIAYLTSLIKDIATTTHAVEYGKIIADKALLRIIIEAGGKISSYALDPKETPEEVLDKSQQELFKISKDKYQNYDDFKTITKDTFLQIQENYKNKGKAVGLQTGFKNIDIILSGLKEGNLFIIGGRPGMGKTAFSLSMVQNMAIETREKIPTGIFSLEMTKFELCNRILCAVAQLPMDKLQKNALIQSDWPKLISAAEKMSKAPLYIDETPGLTMMELSSKARSMVQSHGVKFIILDYLQLVGGEVAGQSREQFISATSRNLKMLAKELEIPICALTQLNRGNESRTDKRPMLSDIRESGSIEQDADMVCFVHRPSYYDRENEELQNKAEIIVAKNRHGKQGIAELYFHSNYPRFDNLAQIPQ